MAKVTITLDTELEEMAVDIDGTTIEDVDSFSAYNTKDWEGEQKLSFNLSKYKKVGDLRISQTICASDQIYKKAVEYVLDPDLEVISMIKSPPDPGVDEEEIDSDKLKSDVAKYFSRS